MQNNRVWQRAYGLTATVVEGVRFDDTADAIVVSARSNARGAADADGAAVDHPVMTEGLAGPRWRALDADTQAETDPRIEQESDIWAGQWLGCTVGMVT